MQKDNDQNKIKTIKEMAKGKNKISSMCAHFYKEDYEKSGSDYPIPSYIGYYFHTLFRNKHTINHYVG